MNDCLICQHGTCPRCQAREAKREREANPVKGAFEATPEYKAIDLLHKKSLITSSERNHILKTLALKLCL